MSTALRGTTRDLRLNNLRNRNDVPITSLDDGDSVTYAVYDDAGIVVATGNGQHISGGNWFASILVPETPGRYKVIWTVISEDATEKFVAGFAVTNA